MAVYAQSCCAYLAFDDKWCYQGTAINEDELYELAETRDAEFDLDIYKLLKKALAGSFKHQVIKLNKS